MQGGSESVASFQNMLSSMFKSQPIEGGLTFEEAKRNVAKKCTNARFMREAGAPDEKAERDCEDAKFDLQVVEQSKMQKQVEQNLSQEKAHYCEKATFFERANRTKEPIYDLVAEKCRKLTAQVNELQKNKDSGVVFNADDSFVLRQLREELSENYQKLQQVCEKAAKDNNYEECERLKVEISKAEKALQTEIDPFEPSTTFESKADAPSSDPPSSDAAESVDRAEKVKKAIGLVKKIDIKYHTSATESKTTTFDVESIDVRKVNLGGQGSPDEIAFVAKFTKSLPAALFQTITFENPKYGPEEAFQSAKFKIDELNQMTFTISRMGDDVLLLQGVSLY
jgi:hypothetical protein